MVEDGDFRELCVVEGCRRERLCEVVYENGEEGDKLPLMPGRHGWDGMIGGQWRWKLGKIYCWNHLVTSIEQLNKQDQNHHFFPKVSWPHREDERVVKGLALHDLYNSATFISF